MSVADQVIALFRAQGSANYFGENVSTTEHSLQTAHFAELAGAPASLVLAALLHDIGHLLEDIPSDIAAWTTDAHHEEVGSRWLAERFLAEVSEPVRLHVPAKRYLLATDARYFANLSPASVITLKLQGGPMTPQECATFEAEPFHPRAVLIRRCDDQGKVKGLRTPGLDHYRELMERFLNPRA
jgi:phosphonate degradation associated HDIG domain protein